MIGRLVPFCAGVVFIMRVVAGFKKVVMAVWIGLFDGMCVVKVRLDLVPMLSQGISPVLPLSEDLE